jgi:hypothetical protein
VSVLVFVGAALNGEEDDDDSSCSTAAFGQWRPWRAREGACVLI